MPYSKRPAKALVTLSEKLRSIFLFPYVNIFILKSSALFSLCLTRSNDWKVKLNGIKLKSTSGKC